jgi:hypothetical protein
MRWTKKGTDYLVKNYHRESLKKLCRGLRRKAKAIVSKARRLGLSESAVIHSCNSDFFLEINPLSSYWAGFIAADGCVYKNTLQINLSIKDKAHLERLKKDIEFTGPVREGVNYGKGGPTARMTITSLAITECLKKTFNIFPNKTLNLRPPSFASEKMVMAYIVGYIDGDGSIGYYKNRPHLSVAGTFEVLSFVKAYFDVWAPPSERYNSSVRPRGNICVYQVTGQRAKKLIEKLSSLKVPKLERKWYSGN